MKLFATTTQAAKAAYVSNNTLVQWCEQRLIKSFRFDAPGGHRRVDVESLRSFLAEHDVPLDAVDQLIAELRERRDARKH